LEKKKKIFPQAPKKRKGRTHPEPNSPAGVSHSGEDFGGKGQLSNFRIALARAKAEDNGRPSKKKVNENRPAVTNTATL